jgi:DNA-binding CsgD family transcriptional regulator
MDLPICSQDFEDTMKTLMRTEFRDLDQTRCTIVRVTSLDSPPPQVERGLILMDFSSGSILSLDRGATAIFNDNRGQKRNRDGMSALDRYIRSVFHRVRKQEEYCSSGAFHVGIWRFTSQAYILENHQASGLKPMVAVLLDRQCEAIDAIDAVGAKYKLTDQELQVLRGVSVGRSIKALAAEMNFKYCALRAMLRLIKIKMGVATRAGIMVKILETADF